MRALLFLGFLCWSASGATAAPEIRFERISIDQGLSQSTVYSIMQDRLGFLWLGTGDGLNRYDGYRFEVLRSRPTDPNSLSHNRIRALHEDSAGMLWIGTLNGGLNRYDRRTRTFTRYRHDPAVPESLASDLVWAIQEDLQGTLWIGTSKGLDRFVQGPEHGAFSHLRQDPNRIAAGQPGLSHDFIRALYLDRAGDLWIGTRRGLNHLDPTTLTLTPYVPRPREGAVKYNSIGSIHQDRRGQLWLGTWNGLIQFDPDSPSPFTFYGDDSNQSGDPMRDSIWDIHEHRDGTLWLATYGTGILRFDPVAKTFLSRVEHDPLKPTSLSGNKVTTFLRDRSGAFWVGTSGNGLNKLGPAAKAFEQISGDPADSEGLSDNMIMAIHEARDGALWLGTWNGGLNRLDRRSGDVTRYRAEPDHPARLARDDVRAVLEDSAGTLWVGTEGGGLHRLDQASGTFTRYQHDPEDSNTLRDNDVWVLHQATDGTLWAGTYGGGLSRYVAETDTFRHYLHDPDDPDSLSSNVVRAIYQDRAGLLWIGTGGGGLNRIDPGSARAGPPTSTPFKRYRHDPRDPSSLSSDEVLSILEDRSGSLWIGTHSGGLNRLLPGSDSGAGDGSRQTGSNQGARFRRYTTADGMPSNVVYGLLEDQQGLIWMSTTRGLCRFDPGSETFRNYDVSDGLQSQEFNSGAYFKSPRGEMFFGGLGGLNAFFAGRITDNAYVPPVVLTSFKKFNREVPLATDPALLRTVTLGHDESVFSFELAALSYTAQHKNRYAYRLVGFRDQWTELGTKRDVTFTNLNPGSYTLEVRASNNDGVWNQEGLALEVIVEPPLWRTWWFQTPAALVAVTLLWAGYATRTRSIRRHNQALAAEVVERRRAEAELAANNAELEARNAEMERFIYTVSHDLKTPLVTIKGFLGYLERDAAAGHVERVGDDVSRISRATDTMDRLLNDLLELSRVGRLMNPPEPVALNELAAEAVALCAGAVDERGVDVQIDPTMPAVEGDRLRLLEVYQNLVDNAVKFLGDQRTPRLEIGASRNGEDGVLCWVRDNGTGIDARYHEKVFGLFERLDQRIPGTGVGLALVKRIVELHGGRTWVESEGTDQGSTFYFTLPPST